ncbi:hypothetical protein LSM04_008157 [Trypanosoma melophagium]|uniref:uncharacterized protein n=1 Tax=Trypanosoma melophagium TaxID=715481 RepID=UPI00351AA9EB|nr:hypothetical protein LSM04_008157 [Trypanosoma melophagium]
MDRSPSLKSLTELPKDANSTSSSSDVNGVNNLSSGPTERRVLFVEAKKKTTHVQRQGEKGKGKEEQEGRSFSSPSEAVESLEQHYTRAVQQLETLEQMYTRLNSHNDELEDNFMLLRTRLDALRAVIVNRLDRAAKELRGDVHLLRETVCFLTQDFASDMRWCQQQIVNRLRYTDSEKKKSSVLLPFATFQAVQSPNLSAALTTVNREDISTSWDSPSQWREGFMNNNNNNNNNVSQSTTTIGGSSKGGVQQTEIVVLQEALEKSMRQKKELEQKLHEQRENYEDHMRSMKRLYTQKESTLQHRVKLLEHFLGSDANKSHLLLLEDGSKKGLQISSSSARRKYSHSTSSSSSNSNSSRSSSRSGGSESSESSNSIRERKKTRDKTTYAWSSTGEVLKQSKHHQREEENVSPSEMWSDDPLKHASRVRDDVERRVQAQMLRGNQRRRENNNSQQAAYRIRPDLPTRREEKELEVAASRLLSAVTGAYSTQSKQQKQKEQQQQKYGRSYADDDNVLNRLYYLPRSPPRRPVTNTYLAPVPKSGVVPRPDALSDVSTVARGLWAEKLLLQRSGRRQ